jgi:hypothetical protein
MDGDRGDMVWLDGNTFVSESEQTKLDSVRGEEVVIAIPYPTVYADLVEPLGALASFVAAFPEDYWETVGEDFIGTREDDDEDSVY